MARAVDQTELAKAAQLRRRSTPHRFVAVTSVAVVLFFGYGWSWVWLWAAAYALVQAVEYASLTLFLGRPKSVARGRAWLAAQFVASAYYGSLAIPLTLWGGQDGEVCAVILIAGAFLSIMLSSRASAAAFASGGLPHVAIFLILPWIDHVGAPDAAHYVTVFGAVLVMIHAVAAWLGQRKAFLAEAAAQIEIERRREETEAAMAAKSAFVAMVSHELRTPLSGVLAAGEQLLRTPRQGSDQEAVAVVVDAGRFMHALLDDLLDLAKLEAGRMTVEAVPFDIGHLTWSVERHWSAAAARAGKPLQLTSVWGLPLMVSGDPTRFRQVLNNLLSNALKFTGPEGVRWTVEAIDDEGRSWVTVRVSDTGPGIAPEKLDRLFTPFDQTDESIARTHGGTGLGLALSRELARLMGGDLRVESELGAGATFILSVPLERAEAVAEAPEEAALQSLPALRILVVDDHEINRRTAALLLEAAGMQVALAASGEDALELLGVEPFDVVITDVNMPGMTGLQLTQTIRKRVGLNRSAPVLAFTGGDSPAEQAACRAAGMRGFISKPVDARALYSAIEEACAGRPRAAERAEVA